MVDNEGIEAASEFELMNKPQEDEENEPFHHVVPDSIYFATAEAGSLTDDAILRNFDDL